MIVADLIRLLQECPQDATACYIDGDGDELSVNKVVTKITAKASDPKKVTLVIVS